MPRRTPYEQARKVGHYTTSATLAVLFVLPMLWTLFASVNGRQANDGSPGWGVANYERLVDYGMGLERYLLNTAAVAAVTVIVTVVATTLGGYAVARFSFPGKNLLFLVTLAILMVPYTTILIPLYVFLGWIGLQNSLLGLALVLAMFQLPFGLFMMRNSFEALPAELEEAALIDGCTTTGALWRVLIRGVAPGMVTVALFSFLAAWNEFVAPLIFLTDGDKFTLPVALFNLQSGSLGSVDFGALQSGVVTAAVPCVLVFLLLQRYYVRGFTSGALKG
ncbi:carbohydrate ABC transporter permease [Plantactinospora solaniradicis]|uniref:Carbohydrate ABC transporter permease n=1 Tax=Plantactinospora solaniradicis TaxID=1723736 RepID=A0ABW1K4E1_9ACTN